MDHFVPTIRRSKKVAEQIALQNHQLDALETIEDLKGFLDYLVWTEHHEDVPVLSGISKASWNEGKKSIAFIEQGVHRICLIQSNKFGGHVLYENLDGNKPSTYLGTCEEFYKGVQDAIYTEMRYAQRTREKVINGKGAKFYSEGQIQIALDFVKASDDAKNEWLAVLNKFVATCGAMDIGLPVGGRQPQDLVPKSLQCK